MTLYPQKITTFGEIREPGVRDVLIYCRDHRCSQVNADRWPDRRSERDEMLAEHGQMDFKRAAKAQSSGAREMAERRTGWSREFDEPIALPNGRKPVTLRDAAEYITLLPREGEMSHDSKS